MSRDRIFAALATLAVLSGLALGFQLLGLPHVQRSENADAARSRDLQHISKAIDHAYHLNQHLPATFDELKKISPGLQTNDPETKTPYVYSVLGEKQYQLCANFATDNRYQHQAPGETVHSASTYCIPYVVNDRLY